MPWRLVRYSELLRASEAGLIDGDPRRPYFWPVIPQGDVFGVQLPDTLWLLERVFILAAKRAVMGVGSFLAQRALERIRRLRNLADADGRWRERLERPDDVLAFLESEPRTTDEVASRIESADATRDHGVA